MHGIRMNRTVLSAAALAALLGLAAAAAAHAGSLSVQAGSRFGGTYGLQVTPDASPSFVQSSHPNAEKTYRVRFYVNLTRINLASDFDLFAAYDGTDPDPSAAPTGNTVLRAAVHQQADGSKVLDVFTRTDSTEVKTPTSPVLANGWRAIELEWSAATSAGANNGFLHLWIDGFPQSGLANLDSDTRFINYARWGSLSALSLGTPPGGLSVNTFKLDEFASQRTGYIGPLAVFSDVPTTDAFWTFIESLYSAEITSGCGSGVFCPNNAVPRDQMAVFLVRAMHGPIFVAPNPTGIFADVPVNYWAGAFIEQLYADGITGGCGGSPLRYCPGDLVTRAQMAIFLLRAKHGRNYVPPPATGTVFFDVPAGSFGADWIEQLFREGITGGCGGGNYCPGNPVSRGQMAVFMVRTFSLPLEQTGP